MRHTLRFASLLLATTLLSNVVLAAGNSPASDAGDGPRIVIKRDVSLPGPKGDTPADKPRVETGRDHRNSEPAKDDNGNNPDKGGQVEPNLAEMTCYAQIYGQDGVYGMTFKNTGDVVITAGSKVSFLMPDGSVKTITVPYDVEPGWGLGYADVFPDGVPEDWTCEARIDLA